MRPASEFDCAHRKALGALDCRHVWTAVTLLQGANGREQTLELSIGGERQYLIVHARRIDAPSFDIGPLIDDDLCDGLGRSLNRVGALDHAPADALLHDLIEL